MYRLLTVYIHALGASLIKVAQARQISALRFYLNLTNSAQMLHLQKTAGDKRQPFQL